MFNASVIAIKSEESMLRNCIENFFVIFEIFFKKDLIYHEMCGILFEHAMLLCSKVRRYALM